MRFRDFVVRACGLLASLVLTSGVLPAQDLATEARRLESQGEGGQAQERLRTQAQQFPNDVAIQRAYAEFLDSHGNLLALDAYGRLAQALQRANAPQPQRAAVARRMAVLALTVGDRAAAERYLNEFTQAGGTGLALPRAVEPVAPSTIDIPGPLKSFSRMAALSPDLHPEDVLPALARNIVTNGYQAISANEALEQTEYLKLVVRYLTQAR